MHARAHTHALAHTHTHTRLREKDQSPQLLVLRHAGLITLLPLYRCWCWDPLLLQMMALDTVSTIIQDLTPVTERKFTLLYTLNVPLSIQLLTLRPSFTPAAGTTQVRAAITSCLIFIADPIFSHIIISCHWYLDLKVFSQSWQWDYMERKLRKDYIRR